jgi:hypothetical protein
MQTRLRTAIVLLVIAGVAGIWLVLAPFVGSYQASDEPWITATTHHVVTGGLLIVVSLGTVLTVIGTALPALTADASSPEDLEAAEPAPEAAG